MKKSALFMVVGAVLLGAVCITAMTAKPQPDAGRSLTSDRVTDRDSCFDPKFTNGFQTLDDHRVIIMSDRDEPYELTVTGICSGLDSTFALGLQSRRGAIEVCGPFDADIVYRDMGRLQTCPITGVRHLTGDEAAPYKRTRKPAAKAAASQ